MYIYLFLFLKALAIIQVLLLLLKSFRYFIQATHLESTIKLTIINESVTEKCMKPGKKLQLKKNHSAIEFYRCASGLNLKQKHMLLTLS